MFRGGESFLHLISRHFLFVQCETGTHPNTKMFLQFDLLRQETRRFVNETLGRPKCLLTASYDWSERNISLPFQIRNSQKKQTQHD